MRQSCSLLFLALILSCSARAFAEEAKPIKIAKFGIKLQEVKTLEGSGDDTYAQSRLAMIPGNMVGSKVPVFLLTTQHLTRNKTHSFEDIFQVRSTDFGKTWSKPKLIPSLQRKKMSNDYEVVMGDLYPDWHAKTKKVLVTGKSFNFENGTKENKDREQVTYAIYDPKMKKWSDMKIVGMPKKDHHGRKIIAPNAGCHQKVHLPNGDVLLPIRYNTISVFGNRKRPLYVTIVARCSFDGKTLKYLEHGSEFTIKRPRGLYEPSVCEYQGEYFLTMRAERTGYMAKSKDGINYEPIMEWKFDDGKPLGSYNTQQHWISNKHGLYLSYTRRGANNDHVMRHRAPLFIAQVNPKTLRVIRSTEKILVPEAGAAIGNFGICHVSPHETWVITSEGQTRVNGKVKILDHESRVFIAKVKWKK